MTEFKLRRLGMLMEPEPGNPHEIEGVLNPAAVRGPDGELYLFPRLVAKENYSRIGIARFGPYQGIDFHEVDDKDASLFPVAIPNPSGHLEMALLHRPLFPGTRPEEIVRHPAARKVDLDRES